MFILNFAFEFEDASEAFAVLSAAKKPKFTQWAANIPLEEPPTPPATVTISTPILQVVPPTTPDQYWDEHNNPAASAQSEIDKTAEIMKEKVIAKRLPYVSPVVLKNSAYVKGYERIEKLRPVINKLINDGFLIPVGKHTIDGNTYRECYKVVSEKIDHAAPAPKHYVSREEKQRKKQSAQTKIDKIVDHYVQTRIGVRESFTLNDLERDNDMSLSPLARTQIALNLKTHPQLHFTQGGTSVIHPMEYRFYPTWKDANGVLRMALAPMLHNKSSVRGVPAKPVWDKPVVFTEEQEKEIEAMKMRGELR